jgi:hypothetical protein
MGSSPIIHPIYAGMAELADALDLGSSVIDVGVQVLFPAPILSPQKIIIVDIMLKR